MASQFPSNGYFWRPNQIFYCWAWCFMVHNILFGLFGSAVLVMSPPSLLPTQGKQCDKQKHCASKAQQQPSVLVLFQPQIQNPLPYGLLWIKFPPSLPDPGHFPSPRDCRQPQLWAPSTSLGSGMGGLWPGLDEGPWVGLAHWDHGP